LGYRYNHHQQSVGFNTVHMTPDGTWGTMVYNGMHDYSLAYNSVQWSFATFPPGRPPNRGHEHTIDLRLPRIKEGMGEPRGEAYIPID
jgi:hypothetical protein